MAEFNMGYPKQTGNTEADYIYLYNFVCEMSDRLSYLFAQNVQKMEQNTQETE